MKLHLEPMRACRACRSIREMGDDARTEGGVATAQHLLTLNRISQPVGRTLQGRNNRVSAAISFAAASRAMSSIVR